MAQHIVAVVEENRLAGCALVEKLAVPELKKRIHFRSFASKFCHFFMDPQVYAIMDNRNATALECHLGQKEFLLSKMLGNYELFCSGLSHLRKRDSIGAPHRAVDHYLYLWELLRRYRRSQPIAYEIAALFEEARSDRELREALVTLEST